jgi:hypothetical protein
VLASNSMTSRVLVGLRLALLVSALFTATGCPPDAPKYAVRVDSPVAPWKPADPDDLVVETEDDEPEDKEDKDDAKEE